MAIYKIGRAPSNAFPEYILTVIRTDSEYILTVIHTDSEYILTVIDTDS